MNELESFENNKKSETKQKNRLDQLDGLLDNYLEPQT